MFRFEQTLPITYDDIEAKEEHKFFCPPFDPYLCGIDTKAMGLCRKSLEDCNKQVEKNIIPLIYQQETEEKSDYAYESDDWSKSCLNSRLDYVKEFNNPEEIPINNFNLMTFNIWGLDAKNLDKYSFMEERMIKIANIINRENVDIVCLQEMSKISFGYLNSQINYPYQSEDFIIDNLNEIRERTIDNFCYLKYQPERIEIHSLGGTLNYKNVLMIIVYPNLIIFNIYLQAGSEYSPGQELNAIHYHRCRREQHEQINYIRKTNFNDMPFIVCGDFNCDLNGPIEQWPELNEINHYGAIDTFRHLNPDDIGLTEDTDTNFLRWNTKFLPKHFRYDGIFGSRELNPTRSYIIGNEPYDLSQEEKLIVFEFLRNHKLGHKLSEIIYKEGTTDIMQWMPSDHYGVITYFGNIRGGYKYKCGIEFFL